MQILMIFAAAFAVLVYFLMEKDYQRVLFLASECGLPTDHDSIHRSLLSSTLHGDAHPGRQRRAAISAWICGAGRLGLTRVLARSGLRCCDGIAAH